MPKFKLFCFLLLSSIALVSCKKKNCHENLDAIFGENDTIKIYEGAPLNLGNYNASNEIEWSGPNGLSGIIAANSYDYLIAAQVATYNHSGTYSFIFNDPGCRKISINKYVSVIDAPSAPCALTNNKLASPGPIISGGTTLLGNTTSTSSNNFSLRIFTTTGHEIIFNFYQNQSNLVQGEYIVESGYYPSNYGSVSMYISGGGLYDYLISSPGKVYVSKENGQYVVSFCNVTVKTSNGTSPTVMSLKYTLP